MLVEQVMHNAFLSKYALEYAILDNPLVFI